MAKLAVNGGSKLFTDEFKSLPWPERNEETAELLKELYLSGNWSFNSETEQKFEAAFAKYHGAKHGIFMTNGTVTLECACQAVGVKPGSEVIVPALTWMATALAPFYLGAKPVIVDIDPETLCMDPEKLEAAITKKTAAIIPVHVYGSTADMERILEIANRHGIPVIEDCAHMQGGFWNGRGDGSWGKVGSFSFQQSKTIAAGEGGICITDDDDLAEKIFLIKHIGYVRGAKQGHGCATPHGLVCHNYRATAFQALILLQQLKGLRARILKYGEFAKIVTDGIADIPGVRIQKPGRLANPQGYYTFHMIFDGEPWLSLKNSDIMQAAAAEGVNIGNPTHGPVYRHPLFNLDKNQYRISGGSTCPVCDKLTIDRICGVGHQTMYYPETAHKIVKCLHKLYENIDELKKFAASNKA